VRVCVRVRARARVTVCVIVWESSFVHNVECAWPLGPVHTQPRWGCKHGGRVDTWATGILAHKKQRPPLNLQQNYA
jgi:hypothetical protein